jgi:hypothetical protein
VERGESAVESLSNRIHHSSGRHDLISGKNKSLTRRGTVFSCQQEATGEIIDVYDLPPIQSRSNHHKPTFVYYAE